MRKAQIAIRVLAPGAAALALVSVLTPETDLQHDLVLIAPERAQPGMHVPLRAFVYAGLQAPEGPRLVPAQVSVELSRGEGGKREVIVQTTLKLGHGPSLEGSLRMPTKLSPDLNGESLRLVARARLPESEAALDVERALKLLPQARSEIAPRALRPLQQLALGPVRERSREPAPSALQVRVAGGACVPEEPCDVLVYVGEPASEIAVEPTPSVTLQTRAPETATSEIVALRVQVHGPEAELRLLARRNGIVVATRSVRLPVALGADAMQLTPRVLRAEQTPSVVLLGTEPAAIADTYVDGHWHTTQSITTTTPVPIRLHPGWPKVARVQLRRDPFESASAAVRTFYMRGPAQNDASVLMELSKAVLERAPSDSFARQLASSAGAASDFDRSSGYLLAALDDGLCELPTPASGYPRARARAAAQHKETRKLALIVIALAATSLVLLLVQRGLAGSAEASRVLRESGVGQQGLAREKLRMTVRLIAVAVSVLLAFFAIALYLVVRGRAL